MEAAKYVTEGEEAYRNGMPSHPNPYMRAEAWKEAAWLSGWDYAASKA